MGIWEQLKSMLQNILSYGHGSKFRRNLLLLLGLGICLLLVGSFFNPNGRQETGQAAPGTAALPLQAGGREEEELAKELTAILNQIRGVSNVRVFLTLDSSGELALVADRENSRRQTVEEDSGGGTREILEETLNHTHVILKDQQGKESPLVVKEYQPVYRGVLVVAEGVDDPHIRLQVVEALKAVLGLPYHRITVLSGGN